MSRVTYPPSLAASDGPAYDPTDRPFVPAAGGGVTTLIYDAFTDTASTNLTAHTPDEVGAGVSSNWTIWGGGTWAIDFDGSGAIETAGAYTGAYVDVGVAEHVIRTTGMGSLYGLVTRFIDASNHFLVYYSVNKVQLYENGATLRAETTTFISEPEIRITTTASGITVWASDGSTTDEVSYASTTHNTATKVGLAQSGSRTNDINDFICIDSTDTGDLP